MWILPVNQGGGQRFSSGSISTSAITTGDAESGGGAVSDLTLLTVTVSRHPYGGGIEYVRTDDRANRCFGVAAVTVTVAVNYSGVAGGGMVTISTCLGRPPNGIPHITPNAPVLAVLTPTTRHAAECVCRLCSPFSCSRRYDLPWKELCLNFLSASVWPSSLPDLCKPRCAFNACHHALTLAPTFENRGPG